MMERMKIGVIGCGAISGKYLENLTGRFAYGVEVAAVADLIPEKAQARAQEFGVPRVCTPDELIADPEIGLVVNLTIPVAHYEVSLAALEAGKHVYTEKPLGVTREEGRQLVETARAKGVRLGGAPDTFLGAGLQTCRKLIDEGWVGTPVTATAFIGMSPRGERYYKRGVGPMLDMGPYFLTALVLMFGPVKRVTSSAQTPFPTKSDQDPTSATYGQTFTVDTPSNIGAVLDFAGGVVAVLTTCCDASAYLPRLDFYGTEGVLTANDPNMFSGPVIVRRRGGEAREMPWTHGYPENSRGLGVAEMAFAIRNGRPHRASAELVYHVLDVMQAIHEASAEGKHIDIQSTVSRPEPLVAGLSQHALE